MTKSSEEIRLCTKCVTDKRFTQKIIADGDRAECDFDEAHGKGRKTISIGSFSGYVDEFFREHYQLGREEPYFEDDSDNPSYRQRGLTLLEILRDELGSDDDSVVGAIIENLPDVSDRDIIQGADRFYDDTANYECIEDAEREERADQEEYWYSNRFRYQWEDFCEEVQYKRRFFNVKQLLDTLFGNPSEYTGGTINPVYSLEPGTKISRTDIDDNLDEKSLSNNPAKELGAFRHSGLALAG